MTMKTLWGKVEPILWYFSSLYLYYTVYALIIYRPTQWRSWGPVLVLVVAAFWWTGFKKRLVKLLRESLREMIVEELQESRMAFVTWLCEDAPWRGENPFPPPPEGLKP